MIDLTNNKNLEKESIWKLKIKIPFKTKKKERIDLIMYFDCSIDLKTKTLCNLIEEKIKEKNKKKRTLFVSFGTQKYPLYPETCPAFVQKKYIELFGYTKKNILSSKVKEKVTKLLFIFKRQKALCCNCNITEAIDLSFTKRLDFFLDPPKAFRGFKEIYLNGNGLLKIPIGLLNKKKLRFLDLCGNNIDGTQLHLLSNLILLEKLCLKNNLVEDIPEFFFSALPKLEVLILDCNKISFLREEIKNLKSLKILSIINNKLKTLPDSLSDLKKLSKFYAQFNKLEKIPSSFFFLENLTVLNLKKNFLSINKILIKTKKLIFFDFSQNKPNSQLNEHKMIEKNNEKQSFIINKNEDFIFSDLFLYDLKELLLQSCNISYLPNELFKKTPNIVYLNICKNNLFQLPQEINNLKKLVILNAHGNSIRLLTLKFSKMPCLKIVDLHSNNIETIPDDIWESSLSSLNLSGNRISEFPQYISNNFKTKKKKDFFNIEQKKEKKICNCFSSENNFPDLKNEKNFFINKNLKKQTTKNPVFISEEFTFERLLDQKNCINKKYQKKGDDHDYYIGYKKNNSSNMETAFLPETLFFLNISQNKLTKKGISSIKHLFSLVWLNLSDNNITNISKLFPSLKNLFFFSASNNQISFFPKEIKKTKKLKILLLSCNEIASIPSDVMISLKKLNTFDISYNNLYKLNKHVDEWNWNQTPSLSILNIEGNHHLTISTNLYLDSCDFIRRKKYFALPFLKILNVQNTQIPESVLPFQKENLHIKTSKTEENEINNVFSSSFKDFGIEKKITIYEICSKLFLGRKVFNIFALFQSHGKEKIARKLYKLFPFILKEELTKNTLGRKFEEILEQTFLILAIEIKKIIPKCKDFCSVTVVICYKNKLYIANTGINYACIYTENTVSSITKNNEKNEEEKRIISFFKETGLPKPIFKKRHTRFFGAFDSPEVTSIPTIQTINLKDEHFFLVIGTNIFWKKISHATVFGFIKHNPLDIAAKKIRDKQTSNSLKPTAAILVDLKKLTSFTNEEKSLKTTNNVFEEISEERSIVSLKKECSAPTGNVSMVMTDIKGSSELWSTFPQIMHSVIALHNDLLRGLLRHVGGYEVKKEGDSFFATFQTTEMAIKWCLMAQTHLLHLELPDSFYKTEQGCSMYEHDGSLVRIKENFPKKKEDSLLYKGLSVRMGIHTEEVKRVFDPVTKRNDYSGTGVNKTARICDLADGGEIAVSKEVYESLISFSKKTFSDLKNPVLFFVGTKKLKGFHNLEEIYVIYPKELAGRHKYGNKPLYYLTSYSQDELSYSFMNLSFEEGDFIN